MASGAIFYDKLGKYEETQKIFELLGFKAIKHKRSDIIKFYRCKKTKEHLSTVTKISELLKKIVNMNV